MSVQNKSTSAEDPAVEKTRLYYGEFLRSADQKANLLLVVASGVLLFLTQLNLSLPIWILVLSMSVFAVSIFLCLCTIWPRQHLVRGLLGWSRDVTGLSQHDYAEKLRKLSDHEYVEELTASCYQLARILAKKYVLLQFAVATSAFGAAILAFWGFVWLVSRICAACIR